MHSAVASVISSVRKKIHLKNCSCICFLTLKYVSSIEMSWMWNDSFIEKFSLTFGLSSSLEREKKVLALKWLKTIPNFRLGGVWGWRELVPRCDFCPWLHFIYCPLFLIVIKTVTCQYWITNYIEFKRFTQFHLMFTGMSVKIL